MVQHVCIEGYSDLSLMRACVCLYAAARPRETSSLSSCCSSVVSLIRYFLVDMVIPPPLNRMIEPRFSCVVAYTPCSPRTPYSEHITGTSSYKEPLSPPGRAYATTQKNLSLSEEYALSDLHFNNVQPLGNVDILENLPDIPARVIIPPKAGMMGNGNTT